MCSVCRLVSSTVLTPISASLAMYQRFLNRMATKKTKAMSAELVEKFNDKAQRHELFFDYAKCEENIEKLSLVTKRRRLERQLAHVKFRPKTHVQLTGDEQSQMKIGSLREPAAHYN